MKQYDKVIFVPDDEYGQYQAKLIKDGGLTSQKYAPHFNAIVCTKEELRSMGRLAMQHGVRPYDTVSFEDFLESKQLT